MLVDKAELAKGDGERGQNVAIEIKLEGERRGEALEAARTELLWDRAFAPFWSTQLGVRHDSGVQGLAPYWFETETTAYWRSGDGWPARFNVKYELLFTSRVILEPELGMNLYSRTDPDRGTGGGLSSMDAGLRLRYEITRKFAPYVGVTWTRQFGEAAEFTRMRGGDRSEVQALAGLRLWF
ncbi:copper resistance protein B [Massilia niastensis]|uniref:copper resistance protein B n=1 Tax=Massilia niastensis TaxID=544911 RepID=UPI001E457E92|nr:copper resistance protein B [Massilia niastensis]